MLDNVISYKFGKCVHVQKVKTILKKSFISRRSTSREDIFNARRTMIDTGNQPAALYLYVHFSVEFLYFLDLKSSNIISKQI